jgi:hypothetical protein
MCTRTTPKPSLHFQTLDRLRRGGVDKMTLAAVGLFLANLATTSQWWQIAHDTWPGATGWSSNYNMAESSCGAFGPILGGYQLFGAGAYVEKTFDLSALSGHSAVRVTLSFVAIDSWDTSEDAQVYIDGALEWSATPNSISGGSHECGRPSQSFNREKLLSVEATVNSTASNVTVRITSTILLEAVDEYWGINNVSVFADVEPVSPPPTIFAIQGDPAQLVIGPDGNTCALIYTQGSPPLLTSTCGIALPSGRRLQVEATPQDMDVETNPAKLSHIEKRLVHLEMESAQLKAELKALREAA